MNILLGLASLFVGFFIWFFTSVIQGVGAGLSGKNSAPGGFVRFGFGLMVLGPLAFWIGKPAYQEWWNTRRSMALLFIVPSTAIGLLVLLALVTR